MENGEADGGGKEEDEGGGESEAISTAQEKVTNVSEKTFGTGRAD